MVQSADRYADKTLQAEITQTGRMMPSYQLRAISNMNCKISNKDLELINQNESYHHEPWNSRTFEEK